MSTFTWTLPSSGSSTPPTSQSQLEPAGSLFGLFDQEIDALTLDYVDAAAGEGWTETESSRTAVMMQLEIRYGEWFVDPEAGSRIPAMLESGDPVLPEELVDETRRALQLLVDDGIIADLVVALGEYDAEQSRIEIAISYTDRSSGHAVDLVYSPT